MKNKQSNMVFWAHLQYTDQVKAMDLISDLIENQSDQTVRLALAAAVIELELWSNAPIERVNSLVEEDADEYIEVDKDGNPIIKTYIH